MSTQARKGRTTATLTGVGGLGTSFEFGSMRNNAKQRERKGKPVSFGERPADRPMAEALGNGRCFSSQEGMKGSAIGTIKERGDTYATYGMVKPKDPTHFRKAELLGPGEVKVRSAAPKLFAWEQDDA